MNALVKIETLQLLSVGLVFTGLLCAAVGGFGAFHFGQLLERATFTAPAPPAPATMPALALPAPPMPDVLLPHLPPIATGPPP